MGSMVLGMNDALVELTGTLAGLSLAMQNTRIIALSGLITGISATLSMASSEFLSAKSEGNENALKSCIYTGIAYLITVTLLILPYLIFPPQAWIWALATMLVTVVAVSYTHLDVYKRQVPASGFCAQNLPPSGVSASQSSHPGFPWSRFPQSYR